MTITNRTLKKIAKKLTKAHDLLLDLELAAVPQRGITKRHSPETLISQFETLMLKSQQRNAFIHRVARLIEDVEYCRL